MKSYSSLLISKKPNLDSCLAKPPRFLFCANLFHCTVEGCILFVLYTPFVNPLSFCIVFIFSFDPFLWLPITIKYKTAFLSDEFDFLIFLLHQSSGIKNLWECTVDVFRTFLQVGLAVRPSKIKKDIDLTFSQFVCNFISIRKDSIEGKS